MKVPKDLEEKVALITDGRFSGTNRGLAIGHITPEAYSGGLIGLIENGDEIEINIPKRILRLNVELEIIEKRRKKWSRVEKKVEGLLKLYRKNCSPVNEGAHM